MTDARAVIVAVGVLYFVAVAALGVRASRRTRTTLDFYRAGSGIGLLSLTLAALSATLSGFAFIGGPGLVYSVGLGAVFIVLPAALTNALSGWVLAPQLRALAEHRGVITIPEALAVRFESRAVHGASALALLIAVVGYMATNVLALGLAVDAIFGIGLGPGIWLGALVVLAYAAGGGIIAGIDTDVLQGLWMTLASVLVFAFVLKVGGTLGGNLATGGSLADPTGGSLADLAAPGDSLGTAGSVGGLGPLSDPGTGLEAITRTIAAADPEFLSPWGHLDPIAAVSFFFVFSVGVLGQPHVLHKFFMLRDRRQLRWYPLLMSGALILATLLFFGVGMAVKALVVDGSMDALARPDDATPRFLLEHTPALLAALVFSSVAAAIMSTLNSFVNVGAAALTHDLPQILGRTPSEHLGPPRVATALLVVAAALVAQLSGTLVAFLGIFGWGLFASCFVPALAVGLNWPEATRQGALASILTGLLGTLAMETAAWFGLLTLPEGLTVSALTLTVSLLVFVLVSAVTAPNAAN